MKQRFFSALNGGHDHKILHTTPVCSAIVDQIQSCYRQNSTLTMHYILNPRLLLNQFWKYLKIISLLCKLYTLTNTLRTKKILHMQSNKWHKLWMFTPMCNIDIISHLFYSTFIITNYRIYFYIDILVTLLNKGIKYSK